MKARCNSLLERNEAVFGDWMIHCRREKSIYLALIALFQVFIWSTVAFTFRADGTVTSEVSTARLYGLRILLKHTPFAARNGLTEVMFSKVRLRRSLAQEVAMVKSALARVRLQQVGAMRSVVDHHYQPL